MNTSATFLINKNATSYSVNEKLGEYSGINLWFAEDGQSQFTPNEISGVPPGGSFVKINEDGTVTIYGYKSIPWADTGRVLDIVNPWATVDMASNILANTQYDQGGGKIAYNYSPFESEAIIPPHYEIGDAVDINGNHHGIFHFSEKAGRLPMANLKAPSDEEIDHEYPVATDVKQRAITRNFNSVESKFRIQGGEIAARVKKVGENSTKTFAWSLTEDAFRIHNGEISATTDTLFRFDSTGLHIKGEVEARSGKIGNFNIGTGIYSGKSSFSSTANGVYIGTDGISLGSGFSVTSGGYLAAQSGSFGSLSVANGSTQGTYYGSLSGCGGSIGGSCAIGGGGYTADGLTTAVDNLVANAITTNTLSANISALGSVTVKTLNVSSGASFSGGISTTTLTVGGTTYKGKTIHYMKSAAAAGTYTGTCTVKGPGGASYGGSCWITIGSSSDVEYSHVLSSY